MPKVYDGSKLKFAQGHQNAGDLSVSSRMQMKQQLQQLGFAGAQAKLGQQDHFQMRVAQGSFKAHVEQSWGARRQANVLGRMMGKQPEKTSDGKDMKVGSKGASKGWAKEHRQTGRLQGAEGDFAAHLKDLLARVKSTYDSLVYNTKFDMMSLKTMDRQTLRMYMAKAEADLGELTMLYSKLTELGPLVEGASAATQALGNATAELAQMRFDLASTYRTFRQESMVVREGEKQQAGALPEMDTNPEA